jgi:hypothetical protein
MMESRWFPSTNCVWENFASWSGQKTPYRNSNLKLRSSIDGKGDTRDPARFIGG